MKKQNCKNINDCIFQIIWSQLSNEQDLIQNFNNFISLTPILGPRNNRTVPWPKAQAMISSKDTYCLELQIVFRTQLIFKLGGKQGCLIYKNKSTNLPSEIQPSFLTHNLMLTMNYIVQRIVDRRITKDGPEYLVKWKGYKTCENTWQPEKCFSECRSLLDQFNAKHPIEEQEKYIHTLSKIVSPVTTEPKVNAQEDLHEAEEEAEKSGDLPYNFHHSMSEEGKYSSSRSRSRDKRNHRLEDSNNTSGKESSLGPKVKLGRNSKEAEEDPGLEVQGMFQNKRGQYWYHVNGAKGKETICRITLIKRNYMALIEFYQEHLNFRGEKK